MTRANSEKRAGDDPTELAFVQMVVLTEQVPSIGVHWTEE
jgi:hypothetical protein